MLHRKFILSNKYFLKSIHGLWIIPLLIINLFVPLFAFLIHKLNNGNMEIDIYKIIFFFLPISSVWTSVFVSEVFFSDKTKDVFYFFSNKRKFIVSSGYFMLFLLNNFLITYLHFYCIDDYIGLSFKIFSISVFYYGLSMIVLFFSKSAAITIMVLLLYDLTNTFVNGFNFFLLYENFYKLNFSTFLACYFPMIMIGALFIFIVFKTIKNNRKTALENHML